MGARLLDGRSTAAAIRSELKDRVTALAGEGVVPGLGTILVGDDPGSRAYVAGKHRDSAEIGIKSIRRDLPADAAQDEVEAAVRELNEDPACTAFLVQLPLPAHLDAQRILELVSPAKDADGLHPVNLGRLVLAHAGPLPATPRGTVELLRRYEIELASAEVVIIGRGLTVGRPLGLLLTRRTENATVTLCHTGTRDLPAHTRAADIVIAAAGVPGLIKPDMVRPGAVVVDIGITRTEQGLVGDVAPEVSDVAGWLAPMPGGVGPMTRAMLLKNVVETAERALRRSAVGDGRNQMADKPARGLADVVAASTALSDIDGAVGRLSYRGYDINELAGRVSFEECVHLLLRGTLPTRVELDALLAELAAARELGPTVEAIIPYIAAPAAAAQAGGTDHRAPTPMEALRTLVSALSIDDPDAADSSPEANQRKAVRLIAQMPVLVARYQSARTGTDPVPPADDLGIAGNFLLQINRRRPSKREDQIFDECLVLHADHTMNASTFTGRVVAATLSDMHSAITAAMGALRGPLHGGANEAVMKTLRSIPGGVDGVEQWVRDTLAAGKKISGFGHRVYKTEDPRATHLRRITAELAEMRGDPTYYRMSRIMEQTVLEMKGLYPNVDFFAASVYHYLGIPTDLFTPVFAISRMSGWTAHVIEQHLDNRLIRPDSEYVGERDQKWRPIEER